MKHKESNSLGNLPRPDLAKKRTRPPVRDFRIWRKSSSLALNGPKLRMVVAPQQKELPPRSRAKNTTDPVQTDERNLEVPNI